VFVVPGINPSHHAKASDVVKIDRLEPEEAEVREVDPVPAILVASQISLPHASYIVLGDTFGVTDQGCPAGSKRITIIPRLPDEEAASGVGLQVLGMLAILLMRKMGRPKESSAKGISEPNGKPECLRDSVDRVATEVSDMSVRTRSA
jgi:hypothetical protein